MSSRSSPPLSTHRAGERGGPDDRGGDPSAGWLEPALRLLPGSARRVLVLSSSSEGGAMERRGLEADARDDGERIVVHRQVPSRAGGACVAAALATGERWDAILLGPAVLDDASADDELASVAASLGSADRLALVAADGEEAHRLERVLLENGCVIARREPCGTSAAASGTVAPARILVARRDGYRVRAAGEGDESAILELFRRSFHVERSLAHWRWKYRANPYDNGRISLAFAPNGELVGQYCAYPVHLYRAGFPEGEIHQVGDTMTAVAARGVGRGPTSVLARMARHFYTSRCEGRVLFNYGFNTGNIQQLSIRYVGAHKVAEVHRRELAAGPPRAARRGVGRWLARYLAAEVSAPSELDATFDELFRDCRDAYGALVERDARYLRWRYFECPDLRYRLLAVRRRGRLVGWGVFLRRDRDLVWGDALFRPDHAQAVGELLEEALRAEGDSPPERIVAWFPPHPPWWDAALRGRDFVDVPEPQELGLMVVPFLDRDAPRWTGRTLYYTYGDSDLF